MSDKPSYNTLRLARSIVRKQADLKALRDGAPPYDAPYDGRKSLRLIERLRKIHLHSLRAVDASTKTLAAAYDTPGKVAHCLEQLDAAIDALDALRSQLRKRRTFAGAAE